MGYARLLKYVGIGLLISAFPGETANQALVRHDIPAFCFTITPSSRGLRSRPGSAIVSTRKSRRPGASRTT
jgi:hypothetical protein